MAKQSSQERRKQMLRERRAEEQREANREDAEVLFQEAEYADRDGDAPAADRLLKKVLILDPNHLRALDLLAGVHERAGHYADALGYLHRLRKLRDDPATLYNIGVVYREMGQAENALRALHEFLEMTIGLPDSKWRRLRESAQANLVLASNNLRRQTAMKEKPSPVLSKPPAAEPAPPLPPAPEKPEPPRVTVRSEERRVGKEGRS